MKLFLAPRQSSANNCRLQIQSKSPHFSSPFPTPSVRSRNSPQDPDLMFGNLGWGREKNDWKWKVDRYCAHRTTTKDGAWVRVHVCCCFCCFFFLPSLVYHLLCLRKGFVHIQLVPNVQESDRCTFNVRVALGLYFERTECLPLVVIISERESCSCRR